EKVPEPADTLEGLLEQLKSYHKDKVIRKQLHNRIKEVRKQKGDNTIPVIVNGELVKFDVPPVIKHNRTLIPVRAVTNALGASVEWDRETNDVTVTKAVYSNIDISIQASTIKVVIDLDTGKYYKDGVEVDFDVPAQVISNRTVVPIRFLAEIFGMKVDWDKDLDGVVVDDEEKVTYPTPTITPETTVTPTPSPNPTP
ncbi:MAG: copper amine oxidase N-terminal domain-containing protein, partial [Ruminiclostridium sp.]|nr:copper amine oxidase N-terminal domain-containing protein [Ruminiclostridium sp.]